MEAMAYEYLMRRVYNCGRNRDKGADADIYRPMDRNHHNLTTRSLYETQDEREYEFRKTFAKVRGNVKQAINDGVKQIGSSEGIEALKKMSQELTIDFYSKERMDEIIDIADSIFRSNGLEIR